MKFLKSLLIVTFFMSAFVLTAGQAEREAAYELLKTIHSEEKLDQDFDFIWETTMGKQEKICSSDIMQKRRLSETERRLRINYKKHILSENVINGIVDVYTEIFTEKELIEINAFYKTKAGEMFWKKNFEFCLGNIQSLNNNSSRMDNSIIEAANVLAASEFFSDENFEKLQNETLEGIILVMKHNFPEFDNENEIKFREEFARLGNARDLRESCIKEYAEVFTEGELNELTAFRKTETGMKYFDNKSKVQFCISELCISEEKAFDRTAEQLMALPVCSEILLDFYSKGWPAQNNVSFKSELTVQFTNLYTRMELMELIAFYKTTSGEKYQRILWSTPDSKMQSVIDETFSFNEKKEVTSFLNTSLGEKNKKHLRGLHQFYFFPLGLQ